VVNEPSVPRGLERQHLSTRSHYNSYKSALQPGGSVAGSLRGSCTMVTGSAALALCQAFNMNRRGRNVFMRSCDELFVDEIAFSSTDPLFARAWWMRRMSTRRLLPYASRKHPGISDSFACIAGQPTGRITRPAPACRKTGQTLPRISACILE
jgi:hypothetical protein